MLRPATPLAILFLAAFLLLLLATLSAPIIKAVPLASVNGVNLGVFGYCSDSGCSKLQIGYDVDAQVLPSDGHSDFTLPSSTRSSLSSILVVHPVAALFELVCVALAASAHLHGPAHSTRYLIGLLVLSIITTLVSLLAFLVDILLFNPHLAWAGWLTLASVILTMASGVLICAMRRTLVTRKDRQRRVAENDEMNGTNFYATQNPVPQGPRAESPPPLASGAIGDTSLDKLPSFATFEKPGSVENDRIPLTRQTSGPQGDPHRRFGPGRTPTNDQYGPSVNGHPQSSVDPYHMRGGRGGRGNPRGGRGYPGPRGYGGPMSDRPEPGGNQYDPTSDHLGPRGYRRDRSEPPMRNMPPGSGHGYRGRGGYGPGPRGYARGGPPRGRGGPYTGGPVMRQDGYAGPPTSSGLPPMFGASREQDWAYQDRADPYREPNPGPAGFGRSPSAPAHGGRQYMPTPPRAYSPPHEYERRPSIQSRGYGQHHDGPANTDPAMIGQAVEMDSGLGSSMVLPGSDSATTRSFTAPPPHSSSFGHVSAETGASSSTPSAYTEEGAYIPARAAWKDQPRPGPSGLGQAPMTAQDRGNMAPFNSRQGMQTDASAQHASNPQSHARNQSDNYLEDVDPRFATADSSSLPNQPSNQPGYRTWNPHGPNPAPSSGRNSPYSNTRMPPASGAGPRPDGISIHPVQHGHDDFGDGQRSPGSDHSNMTSISQRGINPRWHPGADSPMMHGNGARHPPLPSMTQRNLALDENPDFRLPGRGGFGPRGAPPRQMAPPPPHTGRAY